MDQIHQKRQSLGSSCFTTSDLRAKDGTIIVALQWDYAAGRQAQASFTDEVQSSPGNRVKRRMSLSIFPEKFPRVCARIEKRG